MISDIIRNNNPLERNPDLKEVSIVSNYIKEHQAGCNKAELIKNLSNIINKEKTAIILDYLIISKKASVDTHGMIGWIYYPRTLEENNNRLLVRVADE